MRKMILLVLVAGLVAGSLAVPAGAAKKAKPVKTTLFLLGDSPAGEIDGVNWFAEGTQPMQLTPEEPSGSTQSMNYNNPALNTKCTGLPLGFPTYEGRLAGTIKGDIKLTLNTAGAPGQATARIWTDTPVFSCNEAYIQPPIEVTFEVPAGRNEVEVVIKKANLKATHNILFEVLAGGAPRGRLLYGSSDALSRIEFSCVPLRGKSCTG